MSGLDLPAHYLTLSADEQMVTVRYSADVFGPVRELVSHELLPVQISSDHMGGEIIGYIVDCYRFDFLRKILGVGECCCKKGAL